MEKPNESYLGDGVYASFDGYHIFLDLRAQAQGGHVCRIGLEPPVLKQLDEYAKYVERFYRELETERQLDREREAETGE